MLKLVLLKPGWWSRFFQERWRASKLGIASEINISLLGPGTGTRDHGTIWAQGTMGPSGPWTLGPSGPRAHLSPCRYAEDDFFAPYMRSKVCPILVAPRGMSQVQEKPWTVESQQRQLLREMMERSEVLRQT